MYEWFFFSGLYLGILILLMDQQQQQEQQVLIGTSKRELREKMLRI